MMLLSPLLAASGPPPQAVLDKRWLWQVFLLLLAVTFVLRLIGLDLAGALLSGLLLCLGVIVTRNGMQELGRYALIYAVLCALNFFFDALPLITELGGRVSRSTEPLRTTTDPHGVRHTTFTLSTRTTPFFDKGQGALYNVQSLAMILAPLCMALGTFLAVTAHNEIQRLGLQFDDEEDDLPDFEANAAAHFLRGPGAGFGRLQAPGRHLSAGRAAGASTDTAASVAGEGPAAFQGRGHKLG